MIPRLVLLAMAVGVNAGGSCRGKPQDESNAYCQNALEGANIPVSRRADVCDACCQQHGVRGGRMVNGQCTCSP